MQHNVLRDETLDILPQAFDFGATRARSRR